MIYLLYPTAVKNNKKKRKRRLFGGPTEESDLLDLTYQNTELIPGGGGSQESPSVSFLGRGQDLQVPLGMLRQRQKRDFTALCLKSHMEHVRVGFLVTGPPTGAEVAMPGLLLCIVVLAKSMPICQVCSLPFLPFPGPRIH